MTQPRVQPKGHRCRYRSRTVNTGFAIAGQGLGGVGIALTHVALAVTTCRLAVSIGSVDVGLLRDLR